jgi:hypothetical protein
LELDSSKDWRFLAHFGVSFTADLAFYLKLMTQPSFVEENDGARARSMYQRIGELAQPRDYSMIKYVCHREYG